MRVKALVGFLCLLCLGGTLLSADWPQFLGPNRDGVSTETGLLDTWPRQGPEELWRHDAGEGYSSPVVAGGRLVLFARNGTLDVVECLDAATGKGLWKFTYPTSYRDDYGKGDGPRATPLLAGNRVYTIGAGGTLHCLDLENGKSLWVRSVNETYGVRKAFFGVGSSPLLEGGRLLVNAGGKGAGVVAFDAETGKEVWKSSDHEASYASPVAATIDGVRQAIFFTREGLLSLDPANGDVRFSKRWRARIAASVNACSPLVLDGHVFVSSSYNTGAGLFRIRKDGLEEVWSGDEILSAHFSNVVRQGDQLYGFDGRQEEGARLRCIDWKTGKVRWNRDNFGCGSILLADGKLFILTEQGDLVLVEAAPEAYREKARARVLQGTCRAQLALADGRLYGRDETKLVCWKVKK